MSMTPLIKTAFNTKPPFVKVTPQGFLVYGQSTTTIEFMIHDFAFLRKLFSSGQMTCYSLDAVTSKDGRRCELCTWNYTCNKVVRLMILINQQPNPVPAILDVNEHSIEQVGELLEAIEPSAMHTTPVCASIHSTGGKLNITFEQK